MFAGHFGLAAAAKSQSPSVPLWALMLSTQLLDVLFVILYLAGIEGLRPVDPAHPNAYGGAIISAPYTHSLLSAIVLALLGALLVRRAWGQRGALTIGLMIFSHWVLDLIVHRPDLPILPGNAGNLPLLGFGLWDYPGISVVVEAILVLAGAFLYWRAAIALPAPSIRASQAYRTRAFTTALVVAVLMILSLVTDYFGLLQ
jgi:membrane-bound metal-dependent hydrolase YbcI (DUF457 family)